MTTYEQELINRITEQELETWCKKNNIGFCGMFNTLSELTNKSIIELCYEIKPITVERLNAISIEQWKKWAERYGGNFEESVYCSINYTQLVKIEYGKVTSTLRSYERFRELLAIKNKRFIFYLNFLEATKAIHDLVWELENI